METNNSQQQENLGQNQQQDAGTGTEGQQAGETFINQEAVQKAINRQHAKYQEERTKRLELETRFKELEAKVEVSSKTAAPTIPERPGPLDDDYEVKLAAREKAIRDRAVWDQQEAQRKAQQTQTQQTQQQQTQQEMTAQVQKYSDRAVKLGVVPAELAQAEQSIAGYLKPTTANYLLRHEQGPLIVKHLAGNILELDKLSTLSDIDAAVYIAQKVVPKVAKPTGKINPDDQLDTENNSGNNSGGPQQHRSTDFMRGVTME